MEISQLITELNTLHQVNAIDCQDAFHKVFST